MEFVNKAYGQAVELGKSMTPGARVTAALLAVATVVSLAWLFNQQVAANDAYLMGGEQFSPSQLREMQAAFGKAGLEAQLDGTRIKVPRGQESKYMAALADAEAMPVEFGQYMQKAVSTSGFLRIPHSQQQAAWRVAQQKELQLIVSGMRGIERAAVQIDEETVNDFPRDKKSVTAAVTVHPQGGQALDEGTVRTIKQLIASSVAGLKADDVTVVDMSTNRHYGSADANPLSGANGGYADLKKRHELEWQQTIGHLLKYIPGVLISTNVELDVPAGDEHTRAGAMPRRVTASVAVPSTYYLEVWRRETHSPAEAVSQEPAADALAQVEAREKQKIEQLVGNLLPGRDAAAGQVAVSTFYPPAARSAEVELRDKAVAWIGMNWRTVLLVGLSLVGLLVLRSMVRSAGIGAARSSVTVCELPPTLSLVTDSEDPAAEAVSREPAVRRPLRSANLAGELSDAVRQDPEAAVSVLRSWIGNAS